MNHTPTTTLDDQIKYFIGEQYWPMGVDVTQLINKWEAFKASHSSSEKVEKDWEVLSYFSEIGGKNILTKNKDGTFGQFFAKESDLKLSSLFSIHSVRRLSDGEVFSVGDSLTGLGQSGDQTHKIKRIYPINGTIGFEYGNEGGIIIQAAKKAPIQEDRWFLRMKDGLDDEPNGFIGYYKDDLNNRTKSDVYKWFKTKEAAAKYWEALGYPPPLFPVYLTQPQIDKLKELIGGKD